jgi:hypothetical protein
MPPKKKWFALKVVERMFPSILDWYIQRPVGSLAPRSKYIFPGEAAVYSPSKRNKQIRSVSIEENMTTRSNII